MPGVDAIAGKVAPPPGFDWIGTNLILENEWQRFD